MARDDRRSPAQRAIEDQQAAESPAATELERLVDWLDRRTGVADSLRVVLHKVFPDHWSFLLGELALFCFVVLLATGTFLAFFFVPDARKEAYAGPYGPLQGEQISSAFASVMRLSFEVRAGLLFRQAHHWAALMFVAAIAVHLARVFFTAAFRKPRELNWLIGVGLLLLALFEGLSGYSLPDDLLSGTGIRIFYSVLASIPFLGPWLANLLFAGTFPTTDIIPRLFVLHILFVPALLIVLISIHIGLVFLQQHSQFKRGAAREDNAVGLPFWPQQAFRSIGLMILTAAVVGLFGGILQINPVWIYGPYDPFVATAPAQPDWYLIWLEGLLRLGPSFEPTLLGVTIPELFLPGIVVPLIVIVLMLVWPWIDARITGDRQGHNLLDWWWERPFRTATGAAVIAAFGVVTVAGSNDVLAAALAVPVERITVALLCALLVLPVATWVIVLFGARQRRRRPAREVSGVATSRPSAAMLRRNAEGGFDEVEP